jgi:hypothetical protein
MTPEIAARWSALLAAVATVVGAITLVLFFTRGEPWGRLNDASSGVVLVGASMSFLVVLGTRLVTGDIVAPTWNA